MGGPEEEIDTWRILLFGQSGGELLVLRSASGFRLPELHIPRCQRIAPNLNAAAKRLWKLDTVCLSPLELSYHDHTVATTKYHIMELCKPEELVRIAPDFAQMSALSEAAFADAQDFAAVRQAMGLEGTGLVNDNVGPFSGFGAFERISAWVGEQVQPLGLRLKPEFSQLQAYASFALFRFTTNRDALWFKAVGKPNLREFLVTRLLAARLPHFVPELLAVNADWNAWLAWEAGGRGLYDSPDLATWCRVAESLAELQIASLQHTADFLAAGAHDVRAATLVNLVDPYFSMAEEVMQTQTKTTLRRLDQQEIGEIRDYVSEALRKLEAAGIPNTLNHLDLNPCNVVVSTRKVTFLDWAEAGVGNPFFSAEYLRQHFLRTFSSPSEGEQKFCDSYRNPWRSFLRRGPTEALWHLVPLAAVFTFAVCAIPWNEPKLGQQPEFAAYSRSLIRRMHRESQRIKSSRAA